MAVKDARTNAGKTVLETALFCQVSPQAVYQWENGETIPSVQNLMKMSGFFGCTVDELLNKAT